MADAEPRRALYYPHLDFGSAAWVKGALLYWEGLDRMVAETRPHDDLEIRELVDAGLIGNVSGDPLRDQVVALFGERLEDLLEQRGGFPNSIPRVRAFRGRREDLIASALDAGVRDLDARGYRRAAEVVRALPEQAMTLVATAYAQVAADHHGAAAVTDDPMFAALGMYFEEAKVMFDPRTVPAGLAAADLLVPAPSIESLAKLSVAKLLQIRGDLAESRRSFRAKVEDHTQAISSLPSVDAVQDHIRAFAARIRDELEAERDALRRARIEDQWSVMSIAAPASVAVGAAMAGGTSSILGPLGTLGAAALAVTNTFVQRREGRRGGGHYMLALERNLGRRARAGLQTGLNRLLSK